jgi:hypothetical protein
VETSEVTEMDKNDGAVDQSIHSAVIDMNESRGEKIISDKSGS